VRRSVREIPTHLHLHSNGVITPLSHNGLLHALLIKYLSPFRSLLQHQSLLPFIGNALTSKHQCDYLFTWKNSKTKKNLSLAQQYLSRDSHRWVTYALLHNKVTVIYLVTLKVTKQKDENSL
jgi:hypothetical protein